MSLQSKAIVIGAHRTINRRPLKLIFGVLQSPAGIQVKTANHLNFSLSLSLSLGKMATKVWRMLWAKQKVKTSVRFKFRFFYALKRSHCPIVISFFSVFSVLLFYFLNWDVYYGCSWISEFRMSSFNLTLSLTSSIAGVIGGHACFRTIIPANRPKKVRANCSC